jgi:hypothetical protein
MVTIMSSSSSVKFLFYLLPHFCVLLSTSVPKMAVFWDVAPCGLVEVYRRFRGAFCLYNQGVDDGGNKHFPSVLLFTMIWISFIQ